MLIFKSNRPLLPFNLSLTDQLIIIVTMVLVIPIPMIKTSAPTTALYVPPTPHSRQPTPTYKHDDVDNHDYHDVDHDDGDHPNLIGESVVEIRKLGDHQQPWRTTFANLSLPLGSLLLVTSVFKCVGQLMVVVVVVMVDLEVVTDVILFLFGFLIVAQLETQPD